jgi:hypothetical protein
MPWHRMAVILGSVAAVSALGALLFELPPLRRLYARGAPSRESAEATGAVTATEDRLP